MRVHWRKHVVFDWVSNESPHFTNLVGDERPELICTRDGFFGYASVNWDQPDQPWTFHAISGDVAPKKFGHGLGVGDIDGDRRLDLIMKDGWFRQPASGDEKWEFHSFPFSEPGGAQMYAYDVDGDGDSDVITSLGAHDYGLAWFEQVKEDGRITFKRHLIMGSKPQESRYGVAFSELHAVDLFDVDGDGLKDIVTGKTYWSHHAKTPSWNDGAVVYWFKLVRKTGEIEFVPYQADGDSGVGRQVVVGRREPRRSAGLCYRQHEGNLCAAAAAPRGRRRRVAQGAAQAGFISRLLRSRSCAQPAASVAKNFRTDFAQLKLLVEVPRLPANLEDLRLLFGCQQLGGQPSNPLHLRFHPGTQKQQRLG